MCAADVAMRFKFGNWLDDAVALAWGDVFEKDGTRVSHEEAANSHVKRKGCRALFW